MRRPAFQDNGLNYAPCTSCLGFFNKDTLSIHLKKCPLSTNATKITNSKEEGLLLLTPYLPPTSDLEDLVLTGMRETKENEGKFTIIAVR